MAFLFKLQACLYLSGDSLALVIRILLVLWRLHAISLHGLFTFTLLQNLWFLNRLSFIISVFNEERLREKSFLYPFLFVLDLVLDLLKKEHEVSKAEIHPELRILDSWGLQVDLCPFQRVSKNDGLELLNRAAVQTIAKLAKVCRFLHVPHLDLPLL